MENKKRRTLWELQPQEFIIPGGKSRFGDKILPDLIAKKDPVIRGFYRIEIPEGFMRRRE